MLAKEAKAVSGADESATMSEVTTEPSDPSEPIDMRAALAHKEHFAGRLKELEFLAKSKETVLMEVARKVLFDEARAARDAWLNFVPKNAALIAADLGLEAGRVSDILTGYVHRQLAALGNQDGAFSQN